MWRADHPGKVDAMESALERWFADVTLDRVYPE